jgi:hypothetical protein
MNRQQYNLLDQVKFKHLQWCIYEGSNGWDDKYKNVGKDVALIFFISTEEVLHNRKFFKCGYYIDKFKTITLTFTYGDKKEEWVLDNNLSYSDIYFAIRGIIKEEHVPKELAKDFGNVLHNLITLFDTYMDDTSLQGFENDVESHPLLK